MVSHSEPKSSESFFKDSLNLFFHLCIDLTLKKGKKLKLFNRFNVYGLFVNGSNSF